jgi:hypothetical protein
MDVTVFRQSTKQQLGPFPAQTVREMLSRGELSSDDLIYYQGVTAWEPISRLPSADLSPSPPTVGNAGRSASRSDGSGASNLGSSRYLT